MNLFRRGYWEELFKPPPLMPSNKRIIRQLSINFGQPERIDNNLVAFSKIENEAQGQPIFICGCPKSGTTLLASLLDGHSEILVIPEETKFFKKVIAQNYKNRFDYMFANSNICALKQDIIDEPSGFRDYTDINFDILYSLSQKYWENSLKSNRDLLESLVYGLAHATKKISFKYWVEKTPLNENYLGYIKQYWKGALAILIIRDPRQTFCSHREYQHKKKQPTKIRLANFVERWEKSIKSFDQFLKDGGIGITLRYEDLVNDTELVMMKIAQFLNIDFDDNLLCPTRAGNPWSGNSAFNENFSNKVTFRNDNYFDKLKMNEIQYIENRLSSLMHVNGYVTKYDIASKISFSSVYYDIQPFIDKFTRFIRVKLPQFIKKGLF